MRSKTLLGAIAMAAISMVGFSGTAINKTSEDHKVVRGGGGYPNRRPAGAGMASIRAARKTRNVKRHRAMCRGGK